MTKKKTNDHAKKAAPKAKAKHVPIQRSIATTVMSPLKRLEAGLDATVKLQDASRVKTVLSHAADRLKAGAAQPAAKMRMTNIDKNRRVGEKTMRALRLNANVSAQGQRRRSLWLALIMTFAVIGGTAYFAQQRGWLGSHAEAPRWTALERNAPVAKSAPVTVKASHAAPTRMAPAAVKERPHASPAKPAAKAAVAKKPAVKAMAKNTAPAKRPATKVPVAHGKGLAVAKPVRTADRR